MKKLIATLTAIVCLTANMGIMQTTDSMTASMPITAYAAEGDASEDILLQAGKNASAYNYAYADTEIYQHATSQLTMKKTVGEEKVDISTWEDADGFTYGIFKTTVTDISGATKVVVNTDYRVGLVGMSDTTLNVPVLSVEVPADVTEYLSTELQVSLTDSSKVTVIGSGTFSGSYLKTIDLTDMVYIGDSAFAKCSYITEVTIPDTVKYVGDSAFSGSGLKTLNVECEMVNIPDSLCASTQLTKINFQYPEYIKYVGSGAFKSSPIDMSFFEMWEGINLDEYESVIIGSSAFDSCANMTEVVIPGNVIGLDKGAFKSCTNMTSLVFGDNVLYADANCFASCTSLSTIDFNDKIYSLGGGVFSSCTSLVTVEQMPNTLKDWVAVTSSTGYGFGNAMFSGCTSLKSVELPTSITQIPDSVFAGCTALNYVYNSDNITSIGESAFKGCTNLLEAVFPNVSVIEASAFQNCSKLKTFTVGTCTSVGDYALSGCSSLTAIELLADTYGTSVFKDCTSAVTITFNGDTMQKTPDAMFSGCTKLTTLDGEFPMVTIVSPNTFANCSSLKAVNLPEVVIIEDNAFTGCTSLEQICSGDITAEDFGSKCFYNCTNLKQRVNSAASTIGASAFQLSGITELYLDDTVGTTMVIGAKAFAQCPNLKIAEINAPESIKYSIGSNIFEGCTALENAVYSGPIIVDSMYKGCTALADMKSACTTLEDDAFNGCASLKYVDTMQGGGTLTQMASIGDSVFLGCTSLVYANSGTTTVFTGGNQYENCTSLVSADVSSLTEGMFKGCTSLTEVDYLSSAIDIPAECFMNCTSLATVDISDVLTIGNKSFYGAGITELVLDNAETIGTSAFAACPDLKTVNINVNTIGASAFADSQFIEEAVICASTIGDKAFQNCASLRRLTLQTSTSRTLESIGTRAFDNCSVLLEAIVMGNPEIGTKAFGYVNNKVVTDYLLVGEADSTVYDYAVANEIAFCDVNDFDMSQREEGRNTPGDVDGNGLITVVDAVKLQGWLLGRDTPGVVGANMDLNKDNYVDVFDMILLRDKLVQE